MATESPLPPKSQSDANRRTWRTIAQEITTERDPKRFAELTQELLRAMDEQEPSLREKKHVSTRCPLCDQNTEQELPSRGPNWFFCPVCQFSFHLGEDGLIRGSGRVTPEAEAKLYKLLEERIKKE